MRIVLASILALAAVACDDGGSTDNEPFINPGAPSPQPEPEAAAGGCSVELDTDANVVVDTCPGDSVCLEPEGRDTGDCVDALPRRWEFAAAGLVMPDRKANGDCWDAGCGAPDPIVEMYINDAFVGDWGPHQDQFQVTADNAEDSFLGAVNLVAGDELTVVVRDADLTNDDPGLACTLQVEADRLKQRIFACETEGFAIVFVGRMAR